MKQEGNQVMRSFEKLGNRHRDKSLPRYHARIKNIEEPAIQVHSSAAGIDVVPPSVPSIVGKENNIAVSQVCIASVLQNIPLKFSIASEELPRWTWVSWLPELEKRTVPENPFI